MATYADQMREADKRFAGAAGVASAGSWDMPSGSYADQMREADKGFAGAASRASGVAGSQYSPPARPGPWDDPWGSGGLPNWQAPTNQEQVYKTAGEYAPTEAPRAWSGTRDQFRQPSRTEGVVDPLIERMMNRPEFGTNTQEAYNRFAGVRPDIARDAGLGPYYEDAKRRAAESIRTAMSARGAYGSSATDDQISQAMTGLEAERANREADYNLQRLAEQRQWEGLGGTLAGAADQQTLNNVMADANVSSMIAGVAQTGDAAQMDRLKTYLATAYQMDEQTANTFIRYMTAAGAADIAGLGRGDRAFDATFGMGQAVSGVMGQDYGAGLEADQELFQSFLEAMYGPKYLELLGSKEDRDRIENDFQRFIDLVSEIG
jgi:hypothetical protein